MQSTTHTTTHRAGSVAASLARRWPVLLLGICALLALAILATSPTPARAAPASQNNDPNFPGSGPLTLDIRENSPPGTAIGAPIPAATDSDGDTLTYTLSGTDKDKFHFDGSTRQISVGQGTTLNYENQVAYSVILQVSDRKDEQGTGDDVVDDTIAVTVNVTDVVEPPIQPAAPTVRAAGTDGDTTLAIGWTAPDNAGRPDISDYDVQYRAGSAGSFSDWNHTGTATSATISGLQSDTLYQVQVRARNDEGDGPWSTSGTSRTGVAVIDCAGLDVRQDDETTPGATVDLTFRFTPNDCSPGPLDQVFTILLHEDIGFPAGFDEDDVVIIAAGRFVPVWVDDSVGSGEPHEIELPGCQQWSSGSGDPGVCQFAGPPVVIEFKNFKLPEQRATGDDPYRVAIEWDGRTLTDSVAVDAALEIVGDSEVGYGETVEVRGFGFTNGVSVDLYARPISGSGTEACTAATGSGWTEIGEGTIVGSNYRFTSQVTISSNQFRSAGRYQICAVDGAGVVSVANLIFTVTAGLEVVGLSEVSPGERVTLKIVGGGAGVHVSSVRVAGRQLQLGQWSQSGDNLIVTLPPSASGTVTIGATLTTSWCPTTDK